MVPGERVTITLTNGWSITTEVGGPHGEVTLRRPNGNVFERIVDGYVLWAEVGQSPIVSRAGRGREKLTQYVVALVVPA